MTSTRRWRTTGAVSPYFLPSPISSDALKMPCEIAAALLRTLSEKSAPLAGNLSPPKVVLIGLEFPGGRIPDWALVNWSGLMASSSLYLDISLSSRGRLFFSIYSSVGEA